MRQSVREKGATLIELLVTVSIFTILLIMVTGIFSRFVTTERRDISEKALQEDMRLAIELFVREARTGYGSTYALYPSALGQMVVFRNQNNDCVAYSLRDQALQRAEVHTSNRCDSVLYTGFSALTSTKTLVDQLHFLLPQGITSGGQLAQQGFITLSIQARSQTTSIPPLEIQTTVTSRQLNSVE